MRLKKFSLQGFKTFAQQTHLEFSQDNRVTAIVGPNGCGKSNLVDALRWVLGEQSLHSLRVGSLPELIFAGTRAKPPFSMAEVTLTFDNHDKKLSVDFAEVAIKRRIYRGAESDFFINRQDCRLKDILNLFRGTGLGSNAYSIISQGQIEEIILARPEERRLALEEVAGISQYHSQKTESVSKLNSTEANLLRLNDLTSELNQQLAPLEEQARQAQKYVELQKKAAELESALIQEEIKHLIIDKEKNEKELKEARQKILEIEKQCQEKEKALGLYQEANRQKIREYHLRRDVLLAEEKKLMQAENQFQLAQEKAGLILQQKMETGKNLEQAKATLAEYLNLHKGETAEPGAGDLASLRKKIGRFQAVLAGQQKNYKEVMIELEGLQNELAEIERQIARAETELTELGRQKEQQEKVTQQLLAEKETFKTSLSQNQHQTKLKEEQLGQISHDKKQLQEKISGQEKELKKLEEEKDNTRRQHQKVKTNLEEVLGNLFLFQKIQSAPTGFDSKVKDSLRSKNIRQLLAEAKIDQKFVKACQAVLERYAENLAAAEKEHLFFNKPKDNLKKELSAAGFPGICGWADELLRAPEGSQIWSELLANTLIVENGEAAIKLRETLPAAKKFCLVTLNGEVFDQPSVLEDLQAKEIALDGSISAVEGTLRELNQQLQGKDRVLYLLQLEIDQAGKEKVTLSQEIAKLENNLQASQKNSAELPGRQKEIGEILNKSRQNKESIKTRIQQVQENYQKNQSRSQELGQELKRLEIEEATLQQKQREGQDEKRLTQSALVNLQNQVQQLETQLTMAGKNLEALEEEKKKLNEDIKVSRTKREEAAKQLEAFERDFGGRESQKEGLELSLQALRQEMLRWQAAAAEKKINLSSLDLMVQKVQQQLAEKYDLETLSAETAAKITEAAKSAPKISSQELEVKKNQILRCQRQMKNLEPINFYALQEVAKIKERLTFLGAQTADLDQARENLRNLIKQLDAEAAAKLDATIKQVNANFGKIFSRVFNGGTAYLSMCGSENILETGLEIITQFPGKRRQNLLLLSGGERALTAIVFLMSTLEVNPPPFCFFDEVDAALDEANIDRFIQLIREYSRHSQILIITHNKLTISSADAIYGVTMEEPGISKIISLKMEKKEVLL